jgi:hypothetical protein
MGIARNEVATYQNDLSQPFRVAGGHMRAMALLERSSLRRKLLRCAEKLCAYVRASDLSQPFRATGTQMRGKRLRVQTRLRRKLLGCAPQLAKPGVGSYLRKGQIRTTVRFYRRLG